MEILAMSKTLTLTYLSTLIAVNVNTDKNAPVFLANITKRQVASPNGHP